MQNSLFLGRVVRLQVYRVQIIFFNQNFKTSYNLSLPKLTFESNFVYGCNKPYETPSLKLVSTGIEGYSRRRLLSFIEKSPLKIYRKHYEYEFYSKTLDMKVILKFSKKQPNKTKKPTTKFGSFDTHKPV